MAQIYPKMTLKHIKMSHKQVITSKYPKMVKIWEIWGIQIEIQVKIVEMWGI